MVSNALQIAIMNQEKLLMRAVVEESIFVSQGNFKICIEKSLVPLDVSKECYPNLSLPDFFLLA